MKSLSRFVIAQIFTLSALLLPFTASAQVQTEPKPSKPTQDPTVQQVLAGVRASIASTIATLPNVECQEQAHSNQVKKIFIHLYSTKPYYVVEKTDYSLVSLGQKSYLLPENVRATAWLKELNSPDELVYDAKYSDCHIFRSSVRIIAQPTSVTP